VKLTLNLPCLCTVGCIEKDTAKLNVIGPQIRKFREQKGWTQDELAVKLQVLGWDISRESVTRMETQDRRVPDLEMFVVAAALGVTSDELFPRSLRGKIKRLYPSYRVKLSRGQVPPDRG